VRGLANVAGMGFLSCSNDGLIKLWSFDGELQATLGAHNNFVYSVAVSPFGEFVSAGEDGAVCVWRDNERIQTLRHPTGIWSVTVLDSGDIITAGQDSVVRVWTRDAARAAPPEYIAEYESRMSSKVGDLNLNELPTESSLASNPGIKDGETRIVRGTAGNALLYFWKSVDRKWELQGEVQNAINNAGGKTRIGNKEYDQVFDVDLGEGEGGMRKLGVNIGQNEYEAAQEFINREELNQDFLEQIADFIRKNVAPVQLGTQQQDYSVDPFSSNRYRPGGANTAGGSTGAAPLIDPFTPNRYRPGDMNTGIVRAGRFFFSTSRCIELIEPLLRQPRQPPAQLPAALIFLSDIPCILKREI
jgi:phospholipase A-2-activating protein